MHLDAPPPKPRACERAPDSPVQRDGAEAQHGGGAEEFVQEPEGLAEQRRLQPRAAAGAGPQRHIKGNAEQGGADTGTRQVLHEAVGHWFEDAGAARAPQHRRITCGGWEGQHSERASLWWWWGGEGRKRHPAHFHSSSDMDLFGGVIRRSEVDRSTSAPQPEVELQRCVLLYRWLPWRHNGPAETLTFGRPETFTAVDHEDPAGLLARSVVLLTRRCGTSAHIRKMWRLAVENAADGQA